ncbi:MAG: hypothetical protein KQI78_12295 [Deltaproteobacteria bacterium]|nr:hypothetical protein [Deltaproteobacteria bacterium]
MIKKASHSLKLVVLSGVIGLLLMFTGCATAPYTTDMGPMNCSLNKSLNDEKERGQVVKLGDVAKKFGFKMKDFIVKDGQRFETAYEYYIKIKNGCFMKFLTDTNYEVNYIEFTGENCSVYLEDLEPFCEDHPECCIGLKADN